MWTHAELAAKAGEVGQRLDSDKRLVFCRCRIDAASVVNYLGAISAGHAVVMVDDELDDQLMAGLEATYRPDAVLHPDGRIDERSGGGALNPSLHLLLSTSGTTGSPKLVRLSLENVESNAASIREYLELGPGEIAIASLPFHYSYGLSVLNSHLLAGGTIALPPEGMLRPSFWETFDARGCTSFAGVPYSYQLLRRLRWERRDLPSLRTMTQAGGRLDPGATLELHRELSDRGARFVVMYGQTEATARMSWVPPDRLEEKLGSIGVPIPRGRLEIDDGEIVYTGPNVMLGYAESREDLALGDVNRGRLATGDVGRVDGDGFFYVTGRLKRFTKIYGLRINLDEIERALESNGPAAVIGRDEDMIVVFLESSPGADPDRVRGQIAERFRLNPRTFEVRVVAQLPTTASGKIDYAALGDG